MQYNLCVIRCQRLPCQCESKFSHVTYQNILNVFMSVCHVTYQNILNVFMSVHHVTYQNVFPHFLQLECVFAL